MGGEELGQQGRWTVRKARKESEARFSGDQEAAAGVRARGEEKIQGGDE